MPIASFIPSMISGGTSIIEGLMGKNAAKKAADAQVKSQQSAIDQTNQAKTDSLNRQSEVYNAAKLATQPYQDAGTTSLADLMKGIAPGGQFTQTMNADNFKTLDPGYDFRMSEGLKALDRGAAASGGLGSGGTLKALSRYGQDYASGEFNNAFNRFRTTQGDNFGRLMSLASLGQNANGQEIAAGENFADQSGRLNMTAAQQNGQYLTGIGNAQASGYMGEANAGAGMVKDLGNVAASLPWTKMLKGGSGGSGGGVYDSNGHYVGE